MKTMKQAILDVLNKTHGDGMATENLGDMARQIEDAIIVGDLGGVNADDRIDPDFTILREAGNLVGDCENGIPSIAQANALTFGLLRHVNFQRCENSYHHVDDWSPTDWACALGGEVGELLNKIKKLRRLEDGLDKPYNKGIDPTQLRLDIMYEAADVVIYLDLLMKKLDINLGYAVMLKFNETSKRYNFPYYLNPAVPTK